MKKRFIPLVALGSLLGAVVVFFGLDWAINTCHLPNEETYTNVNWMDDIKDDSKLSEIIMPGAHDAATDGMMFLGEAQHKDINNLLKGGTRYLDIRVRKTKKNEYVVYHDIFDGRPFDEVWKEIKDFITANASETLILDFQHFDNGAEEYVCSILDQDSSFLIKNETGDSDLEFVDSITLGQSRGKMLALFGEGKETQCQRNYIFGRNNDSCSKLGMALDSYYDDDYKKSSANLIKNIIPENYNRIESKIKNEGNKGLFVLQCQLTDGKKIFGPYSREMTHDSNMSKYIQNIKDDARRLNLTNIIMRDFLTNEKISEIVKLNQYKKLTK